MSSFKYSDVYRVVYPRRHEGIYKNRGDNPWVSIRIRQGVGRDPSKWFSNQLKVIAEVSRFMVMVGPCSVLGVILRSLRLISDSSMRW
ncbi:hypothetical protein [Vulcanisaeta souniana]|uniref:hypothetical protein n=1 Tax=Vulcanisaeta souniana TaxID=164452 RepID=UPI001FB35CAE|nr:hypothetical protein [Vulcanisaeta souniana]